MKVNKPDHHKNISMMVDLVNWARSRGEGSENRHHFPPRDAFSDPSPLRVMPALYPEWGSYRRNSIDMTGIFYYLVIQ
jgi:hypothetical protein